MLMNKKMILGTVAATLALAGSAFAGDKDACCSAKEQTGMESTAKESTPSEVTLASLMKTPVTTTDGKNLGQVQDLVIDSRTGKIRYAMVGRGDTFGVRNKLVSVPWEAVTMKPPQKQFTLTVDDEKLASAAGDESDSTDMDEVPTVTIYRFYAVPDDQDMGGATTPGGIEEGQGSSDENDADVPSDQQDNDSDSDTIPHA